MAQVKLYYVHTVFNALELNDGNITTEGTSFLKLIKCRLKLLRKKMQPPIPFLSRVLLYGIRKIKADSFDGQIKQNMFETFTSHSKP